MHVFEMVLGIVIITTIAGVINNFMKFKSKSSESMDDLDGRVNKLEDLEERIKVLEKIITDQNYDLDQKIKSL
ncbi:MAG: hypothetical protein GY781_13275 [Gammaproteobacteria bacterium]|nr:hypothetical protein [Gammaproteobacteria bacterium]